jgi:hypothetical protein
MSWNYSLELGEEFLDRGFLTTEQFARLKSTRTVGRSSFAARRKATWNPFPSGTTSELSMLVPGMEWWMSSLAASHVSPGPLPAAEKAPPTPATSGLTPSESFATWDPASASWKTSRASKRKSTSAASSVTWPRAGSMRNGIAYPRPPSAPLTRGTASGYWPTPCARDWKSHHNKTCWDNARPLNETIGGQLNPTWVEWLMGWPIGWTDLEPLATDRFRQWFEKHGKI